VTHEWDHEIELIEGRYPGFEPIYRLSEKELGFLKTYTDENMAKGFIRNSKSLGRISRPVRAKEKMERHDYTSNIVS
jgi:hypothetical protein